MKLFNKVGALRSIPKPSSDVAEAALSLLTIFGDQKNLKGLLTELRDVQGHNEKVRNDANAALGDISKREKELKQERAQMEDEHAAALGAQTTRNNVLDEAEQRFATRIATYEEHERQRDGELTMRKAELDYGLADFRKKLKDYDVKAHALDTRETKLLANEQRTDALRQHLKAREADLRAVLDS